MPHRTWAADVRSATADSARTGAVRVAGFAATTPPHPRRARSNGSFAPIPRAGSTSPTSPSTAPAGQGRTPRWSSTVSAAESWAGRSRAASAPSSWSIRCRRRHEAADLPAGAMRHSGHGATYSSSAFGHRQRKPDCSDRWAPSVTASTTPWRRNSLVTLQTELPDRSTWPTRVDLANAIFNFRRSRQRPTPAPLHARLPQPADYDIQHALRTPVGPPPLHDQIHPNPSASGGEGGTSVRHLPS